MLDELSVRQENDGAEGRFVLERGESEVGEITYSVPSDGAIVAKHTEVDPSLRGTGASGVLFSAFVDWVRNDDLRVDARCPYIDKKFREDSELRERLV